MFTNSTNPKAINVATKHHQLCAMRFMQLCSKRRAYDNNIKIGGYKIRQISFNTAYHVPAGAKETWSEVLFFQVPNWKR